MSTTITTRAKAFSGRSIETIRASVDADGTVRVYDSVAGYYTTCHSLSPSAQRRIRRLAAESSASTIRGRSVQTPASKGWSR